MPRSIRPAAAKPARKTHAPRAARETSTERRARLGREAVSAKRPVAKKAPAAAVPVAAPPASGPRPETLAFAREVVRLRDVKKLKWTEVAEALGVPYGANGSSRLRRAYAIGEGATNGVRANRVVPVAPAPTAKKAPARPARRAAKKGA